MLWALSTMVIYFLTILWSPSGRLFLVFNVRIKAALDIRYVQMISWLMAIVSGSTVKKRVSFHFNPASLLPLSFVTVIQFLWTFFFLSVLSVRIDSVSEFETVYTMFFVLFSFFPPSLGYSRFFWFKKKKIFKKQTNIICK